MNGKNSDLKAEFEKLLHLLKARETKNRDILEKSFHGILIVNNEGIIRFANQVTVSIFGCKIEELVGKQCGVPIAADKATEFIRKDRDGRSLVVETRSFATEWDGEPAWCVNLQDITESKRAGESINISEEMRYAIAAAELGTWHWDFGNNELIWNDTCKELFGYPPDYPITYETFLKPIHEEDRQSVDNAVRKALQEKTEYFVEMRIVLPNGQLRWVMSKGFGFYDEQGKPTHMRGIAMDITEQKLAESALRESEQRFRTLAAATSEGIAITENGRILDINERFAQIVGFEHNELIGQEVADFLPPEDRDRVLANILLGQESHVEHEVLCKDGSRRVVEAHGKTIAQQGRELRITAIRDVTERRQAEEKIETLNTELSARAAELEAVNREMEAFNYTVAHDLRKPLTVINGYSQAIRELCSDKLDEQSADFLREIYNGTLRMNQLIDALLNFSCLAHCEIHRETVNLSEIAKAVALELKIAEPDRRVTFRIAEGITVSGDENLLRVVLENLLGNAWKYTRSLEEAIIEFGMTDIDGKPSCYVRDNGTGFDMTNAEKLFLPFQRLPGTDVQGHGIGLATVERIVKRHGGNVRAEGEPGKGATFFFTL